MLGTSGTYHGPRLSLSMLVLVLPYERLLSALDLVQVNNLKIADDLSHVGSVLTSHRLLSMLPKKSANVKQV